VSEQMSLLRHAELRLNGVASAVHGISSHPATARLPAETLPERCRDTSPDTRRSAEARSSLLKPADTGLFG
jgi:hypothetical protein